MTYMKKKEQTDSLSQCRKVTIYLSMGRTKSKAIVISSGNILSFHIFLLPAKCYTASIQHGRDFVCYVKLVRHSNSVYRREHHLNKYSVYEWEIFECQRLICAYNIESIDFVMHFK